MFDPVKSGHSVSLSCEQKSSHLWCAYTMRGTRGMLSLSLELHKMSGVGSIEKDMDLRGTLNTAFSWKYMTSSAKRSGNTSSASMPYNSLKPRVMRRKLSRGYDWSWEASYTINAASRRPRGWAPKSPLRVMLSAASSACKFNPAESARAQVARKGLTFCASLTSCRLLMFPLATPRPFF
jgi:hypothetical protein